jgi:hypothetical protein
MIHRNSSPPTAPLSSAEKSVIGVRARIVSMISRSAIWSTFADEVVAALRAHAQRRHAVDVRTIRSPARRRCSAYGDIQQWLHAWPLTRSAGIEKSGVS